MISNKKSNGIAGFTVAILSLILALCCVFYAIFNNRAEAKEAKNFDKELESQKTEMRKTLMPDEDHQALLAKYKELKALRGELLDSSCDGFENYKGRFLKDISPRTRT